MRALVWSFRLVIFLVLFAFAAKNTDPVSLRLFFGATTQLPLIVLLFVFFATGALFGILAMTLPFSRQVREKRRLAKKVASAASMPVAIQPPSSES